MSIEEIVRGSTWLYLGALFFSFLGFLFWLIASVFVNPDIIGTAAAVISLESLFITTFSFGINVGVRRFIGSSWGSEDFEKTLYYLTTSLLFMILVNLPIVIILFIASSFSINAFGVGSIELYYATILLLLGFLAPLMYSLLNSVLKTKETAAADIIFSIIKIIVGISLLFMGFGLVGILAAFIVGSATRGLILAFFTVRLLKRKKVGIRFRFDLSLLKQVFHSGIASWIPTLLTTFGQSIAILIIYGVVGGGETGTFYIVFAISLIVYKISDSVMMLMFPVLSGMNSGRKQAISDAIRLSLVATVLMAYILILYPSLLLGIFGSAYSQSSTILIALSVGAIIYPIISGYNSYIYAEGKYAHVTIIGIIMNSARLILYVLLITEYGDFGIAVAYDIGLILAIIPIIKSARDIHFEIKWRQYLKILSIPTIISMFILLLMIPWYVGIPILLVSTLTIYTRLSVITRKDVSEIARAFLSNEAVHRLRVRTEPLLSILFKE